MSEPRWLSADEQHIWRDFLTVHRLLFERLDRQLTTDSGIPHAYYEILVRLSEADGWALRMSQLADSAASSRSRLSHAVSRLEEAGLVVRRACPTDRRGAIATLTEQGFAVLAAAAPGHVEAVRSAVFDPLTPEQVRALGQISGTLAEHLAEKSPAARAS